jgi:hypothetical protein
LAGCGLSHARARSFFYPQIPPIGADFGGVSCRRFFADWGRLTPIAVGGLWFVSRAGAEVFFYLQIPQIVFTGVKGE